MTKGKSEHVGYYLFKIILSLVSLRHPDVIEEININLLEDLREAVGFENSSDTWLMYTDKILEHIHRNVNLWTPVTDELCIFSTILLHSNQAFGKNLKSIGSILTEALDSQCNAEMRLKIFYDLAVTFENKEVIFTKAHNPTLFLENLIQGKLFENSEYCYEKQSTSLVC